MSPPPAVMAVDDNQQPPTTTVSPPTTHHVLLVSLAAQGHMNPMLMLGKRLHSKGLHVTFATTEVSRHRVLNHSNTTASDSFFNISGVNLEFFYDGLSLYSDRSDYDQYLRTVDRFGRASLTGLIRDLHSRPIPKISCIVNNPFVPWVADVAADLRIPCAMLWIQPCSLFSLYYRFYNKISPFDFIPQDEIEAVDIPGLPLLHTVDLPSFIMPSNSLKSIDMVLSLALKPTTNINWILANSFNELEIEPIRLVSGLVPIKPVGPLVSNSLFSDDNDEEDDVGFDMWKVDESCIEWLNRQRPGSVVYVSFGSLLNLPGESQASIATALKKTKMPFLWVMKSAEFGVTDGAGSLTKALTEAGEQGRVVTWCPQSRVLKHPAVGCFLTHCGWSSVLEALTAGVPLVCFPQWTDQPTNAKLVEEVFGVGLRLWPNKEGGVGAEEVERCIEDVMVGPDAESIRARAAEWKTAAREAMADGGSSDTNIQWFIDEVVKLSSFCKMGSESLANVMVHVFMVSFPGQGHVNPLLRLGKRLAAKGLLVTFTTSSGFGRDIIRSTGVTPGALTPVGDGFIRFDLLDDEWPDSDPRRQDLDVYLPQLESAGRRRVPEMLRRLAAEGRPVSCLVNNPFIPWVSDVAVDLGIPTAMLWVQSCACFLSYYYFSNGLVPFPEEKDPYIDVEIPSLPLLKWDEIPSFLHPSTPYPFLRRAILGQYRNLEKPFCVLMDTFDELEHDTIEFSSKFCPVKPVGPLFKNPRPDNGPSAANVRGDQMKADSDCLRWLDSKPERSVVYISFGTVVFLKQEQIDEMAHGVLNAAVSFLWVMKPPHPDTGLKPHTLPDGFLDKVGDNGRVVEYSPQEEVLEHPAVACFVTHCGWNSTMEAITSGVPVVAFPQWGDQVTDAKFLVDVFGVGVRMCRGMHEDRVIPRDEVEDCLRTAIVGPRAEEMKRNAATWKVKAHEAYKEGGSSDRNFEEFVEAIKSKSGDVVEKYMKLMAEEENKAAEEVAPPVN
ncbi:hypothetical protein V2J09_002085 [Rumex salicifolius]